MTSRRTGEGMAAGAWRAGLVCGLALLTACTGTSQVRVRAAADLECPEASIEVRSLELGAFEAFGCGKKASYVVRGGEVLRDAIE